MRFIILAFALIGVVFYISNPQAFGKKENFKLSGGGRVVRNETGGANFDFTKIGEFGIELFESFFTTPSDSVTSQTTELSAVETSSQQAGQETRILSAIEATDISTYAGQLVAISSALHENPEATAAQMQAATQACLPSQAPDPLVNYFSGLVQVVAQTSQLPQAQQVESFEFLSAPLTRDLKSWLQFMPEEQRVTNSQILQDWAARPKDLVACHTAWLRAQQ